MAWVILLAILSIPVLEIAVFIKAVGWIGLIPTVALAILAGMAGIALVRAQGLATLTRVRAQMAQGLPPVAEVFDGLCLLFAGFLLLLPGFCSDILALALLLPPVRVLLLALVAKRLTRHGAAPPSSPSVIEAEYRVVSDRDP